MVHAVNLGKVRELEKSYTWGVLNTGGYRNQKEGVLAGQILWLTFLSLVLVVGLEEIKCGRVDSFSLNGV